MKPFQPWMWLIIILSIITFPLWILPAIIIVLLYLILIIFTSVFCDLWNVETPQWIQNFTKNW